MIPKKLVKISDDMRVDTIAKQNQRDFRPLRFGDEEEPKARAKEAVAKSDSVPRAAKRRASSSSASSASASASSVSNAPVSSVVSSVVSSGKGAGSQYNPLITILCSLQDTKEEAKRKCNLPRLFRIYERRILPRIDSLCQELVQLDGVESELAWVQKNFLPFLNNLAQYFAHLCKLAYEGRDFSYADEVASLLFDRISGECAQLNWFSLQRVYPYKDNFEEGRHIQKKIVSAHDDLHDKILDIRQLGLLEPNGQEVVEATHVVVGVSIQ